MPKQNFTRLDRRAFLSATAAVALAAPLAAFSGSLALAQDKIGEQAEWRQSYEASERLSVQRESTPVLSTATLSATDAAIQQYQGIVERGGWAPVPTGAELKVGMKSKAVQALRQRLVVSGDLDPVAGTSPVFDSFVEAAVKRFQTRHGIGPSGMVNEETFTELNSPADARLR